MEFRDLIRQSSLPLVFMDETSVNVWYKRAKGMWQDVNSPIEIPLKNRVPNITILGAIVLPQDKFLFCLADKTNKESVLRFFKSLYRHIGGPFTCVMDNHT